MQVCLITERLGARSPFHDAGVDLTIAVGGSAAPLPATHEGAVVVAVAEARRRRFDLAVAGDWRSCAHVFAVAAERRALWLEALPHAGVAVDDPDRAAAAIALDLPLDFLVAGAWLQAALAELRPEARCRVVTPSAPVSGNGGEAVVVVGAGDVEAIRAAFAAGATVVATASEGVDALVEHRVNGLLADPDDDRSVRGALALLEADPALRDRLRAGAAATAATWPSPAGAGAEMRAALEALLAEPAPDAAGWPARLMGDALAQTAVLRERQAADREALDAGRQAAAQARELALALDRSIQADRAYQFALRAQVLWRRPALAPVRALARLVARLRRP